nr:hypothetical protein HK105_007111 [Polyrhizophydium stewartii]
MPDGSSPSAPAQTQRATNFSAAPSGGPTQAHAREERRTSASDIELVQLRKPEAADLSASTTSFPLAGAQEAGSVSSAALFSEAPGELPADRGYGWVVVVASFMINVFTIALPASYGIFQAAYANQPEFAGASSLAIAFIGSLGSAGLPLFSIPAGRLVDRFGSRNVCLSGAVFVGAAMILASFSGAVWQIFATQGLLFGIGTSLSHIAGISLLPDWFIKRRGIATGIAVAGSGLGGLMLGPILRTLISQVGWRWTLRLIGIVGGSVLLVCSMLLRARTMRKSQRGMHFSNFRDSIFLRLYAVAVIHSFAYFVPFFYIPTYATRFGMSEEQGALLVGILSGSSGLGRVVLGFAADHIGHINMLTMCLTIATMCLFVVWPFATTFGSVLAFVLVYGFFVGGFVCMTSTVIAQLFGATGSIATVTGMIFNGYLFGDLFGAPIAGAIIDHFTVVGADGSKNTDYVPAIMFAGSCFAVGSILLLTIKYSVGKRRFFVRI